VNPTVQTSDPRVMIVEDEAIAALYLKEMLLKKGYAVVGTAVAAEEAIMQAGYLNPDLVLMDIFLKGKMDGIEAARYIYGKLNIPVIFLTSYSQESLVESAIHTEPFGYLVKPYNESELYACIEIALLKHRSANYLKELNTTRDKFFSVIAHDLRNPLSALFQTTTILKDRLSTLNSEEIAFFLNEINSTAQNLYKLTDNLLEWARLQNERIEFKPVNIKLATLVGYVFSIVQSSANNKQIRLHNKVTSGQFVWADMDMLVSVLSNLITNAIKFSFPNGNVSVSAKENRNYLEIAIEDEGVGIEEKFIDKLFLNIHKNPGTFEEKGTGLGLILTKEFVEKNGGRVSISSQIGQGTCVSFTLPMYETASN
jgi:two-component system sensor histidine kinase/response regulator